MGEKSFKQCQVCKTRWESRDHFIADEAVRLIGYQVNIMALGKGLFLFNHSCDGTMSIHAAEFLDLYDGPVYTERKNADEDCPGHCLYTHDLRSCPLKCDCAYVRDILHQLK